MNKREYAKANLDWLAAKAEEEGVIALPEGIYYKVLSSGNNDGKHPTPRSIVTAHYTGRTINGKKFDSSRGGAPIAFRLSDLIKGWIVAMQQTATATTSTRSTTSSRSSVPPGRWSSAARLRRGSARSVRMRWRRRRALWSSSSCRAPELCRTNEWGFAIIPT